MVVCLPMGGQVSCFHLHPLLLVIMLPSDHQTLLMLSISLKKKSLIDEIGSLTSRSTTMFFGRRDQVHKKGEKRSIIRCGIQQIAYSYNKNQQLFRSSVCFTSPVHEPTTTRMFGEVVGRITHHSSTNL